MNVGDKVCDICGAAVRAKMSHICTIMSLGVCCKTQNVSCCSVFLGALRVWRPWTLRALQR